MAKASASDKFANIAYLEVTESAANTLTFEQLQLANNLLSEKAALIIHRIEWYYGAYSSLNSSGDKATCGLTVSDRVTDLSDLSQPEVLLYFAEERLDLGTAASGIFMQKPLVRDLTSLPGGGIIVPADRLYLGVVGLGCAAALQVKMRLYYTVMAIGVQEYWELIEARRVMST